MPEFNIGPPAPAFTDPTTNDLRETAEMPNLTETDIPLTIDRQMKNLAKIPPKEDGRYHFSCVLAVPSDSAMGADVTSTVYATNGRLAIRRTVQGKMCDHSILIPKHVFAAAKPTAKRTAYMHKSDTRWSLDVINGADPLQGPTDPMATRTLVTTELPDVGGFPDVAPIMDKELEKSPTAQIRVNVGYLRALLAAIGADEDNVILGIANAKSALTLRSDPCPGNPDTRAQAVLMPVLTKDDV